MNVAAFFLLAAIVTGYVLFDGYDLGVGVIHLFVARNDRDRAASLQSIGPFWSGNEVMLVAAGAVLFALFPKVYAASFSGFYLPFMVVLWLLMVRGMSIELRGHVASELWRGFWDVAFSLSSTLLALVFGVALANVIRGVPLDAGGYFTGTFGFLLSGYALAVGLFAIVALAMHGAAFVWMRARGNLQEQARRIARILWGVVLALFAAVTVATAIVHPLPAGGLRWIAPALALVGLAGVATAKRGAAAFAGSSIFLLALMGCAAQTIFPYLLAAFPAGSGGLSIYNAAPRGASLQTGLAAGTIGFCAALVYGTLAARRLLHTEA